MIVTAPIVGVPIGFVTVNGRRMEVATNPEFVRFFEGLMYRVGGPTGPGTPDLSVAQFEDAGIEETKALLYSQGNDTAQMPTADAERINALEKRVLALEQGMSL